jgi:hypothetical protein
MPLPSSARALAGAKTAVKSAAAATATAAVVLLLYCIKAGNYPLNILLLEAFSDLILGGNHALP